MPDTITVRGEISSLKKSVSRKGKPFHKVMLKDDDMCYFDWRKKQLPDQGIGSGDSVELEVTDDDYPSIKKAEKSGPGQQATVSGQQQHVPGKQLRNYGKPGEDFRSPDQFMRGTAAMVVSNIVSRVDPADRPDTKGTQDMAQQWYCWIKHGKWPTEESDGEGVEVGEGTS